MQKDKVDFIYNGIKYHIEIVGADVFPQGFAAVADKMSMFHGTNMLCDIGNGTMSVMYIKNKVPDTGKCFTDVTADNARYMMLQTKEQYNKKDGIAAFHGYQSFAEDEVTPSVAHEIGVKLAEQLWGDRFEVVVATHLNTNHIHNHFVLNSVSFVDGKKFYDNKETKRLMRDTSDKLCREYGLSVIENPQGRGKHYAEWKAEQQGKPTIRGRIREELDEIIGKSQTYIQFKDILRNRGYGYKLGPNVKHGAVKPPYSQRFVRLRSLGEDYTEERIKEQIGRAHV